MIDPAIYALICETLACPDIAPSIYHVTPSVRV